MSVARSARDHAAARCLAETGLDLVIRYVNFDSAWRQFRTPGTWITDQSFGNGCFTIRCDDGIDLNGNRVIDAGEGDSNLADDPTDPFTFSVTGRCGNVVEMVRAQVTPSSGQGVVVSDSVTLSGLSYIDSFSSNNNGVYGGNNVGSSAGVSTNSTSANKIVLSNSSSIKGQAWCGPGGNPTSVIKTQGTATITGLLGTLAQAVSIPSFSTPGNVGTNLGSFVITNQTVTVSSNGRATNVAFYGACRVQVQGNASLSCLCDGNVDFYDTSAIEFYGNSQLTFYVGGSVRFFGQSTANINTGNPARLILRPLSAAAVQINENARVCATVEAPVTELQIRNNAQLYGTFRGKQITMLDNAAFHQDTKNASQGYSVDSLN